MPLDRINAGEPADLRTGDPALDDPANGATWDTARTIEARPLIEILTTPGPPIKIAGARITGRLDLESRTLPRSLLLRACHLQHAPNLDEASASTIRLPGCHLPGLSARQLRTTGDVELNDGFTANGEVDLLGAHIGGKMTFSGATLRNPGGRSLNADRLTAVVAGLTGLIKRCPLPARPISHFWHFSSQGISPTTGQSFDYPTRVTARIAMTDFGLSSDRQTKESRRHQ
ncbi:hypothetical protein [Actinomadura sp. 9N407]|uniref:hypothetical protein n=1 Tax=Actinomadura sp. 9N407 TaxID=3375154 RepID=UPI0037A48602